MLLQQKPCPSVKLFAFSRSVLLQQQKKISVCSKSHSFPTNEYRDEASFHPPMSKQDRKSESSDEARPRYDQKHDIGCAQPTALYKEAATLCFTDSLPSTFKVNIATKNSHHLRNSTYSQQ
ncbi:hypothetical protein FHG87_009785 [Trinorchestia longiramus]|nr:hypothetical protein FHG87_009785 [Trinorchestia longiramus]